MAGTYEAENGDPLTADEYHAIQSLHRLARHWPQALTLHAIGGSLYVVRTGDERFSPALPTEARAEAILETVHGIPSDGGDW